MSGLSTSLTWAMAQPRWAAQLNPVLSNQLVQGNLLTGISLADGLTVINHLLGRQMVGWMIADINAAATIYRSAQLNTKTLTLTSNAACIVNIWVF